MANQTSTLKNAQSIVQQHAKKQSLVIKLRDLRNENEWAWQLFLMPPHYLF